jgi:hypothetical protein
MQFVATRGRVSNRGVPPVPFLNELVAWGKTAPDDIFEANANPADIYAVIAPKLGPWSNLLHRRAAMLEAMRVHAGFEASWNWNEGVDVTNETSRTHIAGQETGVFQVSFDSTYIDNDAMKPFAISRGIGTPGSFITQMKANHPLAMEYYARLVRVSVAWAGPLIRHAIDPWLSRAAVDEFRELIASTKTKRKATAKKHVKEIGYDKRPRFGWAVDLDNDPQMIHENKIDSELHPVAVIPLPFMSSKQRRLVREFAKSMWPQA